jgi:hypothetical protein
MFQSSCPNEENVVTGLLFVAHNPRVSQAFLVCFQRFQELHEKDLPPLRHTIALTTAGYFCNPHELGGTFRTCLTVVGTNFLLESVQNYCATLEVLWFIVVFNNI